jgi:nucleoside 2-deoxyribosyltransferase
MKLPVIYVAGPYRSQTREGVEMNIQAARHVAALCCRKGWSVICPHSNTSHLDAVVNNVDDQFWLDTTMELLRRCDAVVLVPGWQYSSGTLAEIAEAERLELSVYYSENELPTVSEFDRITAIMEKRPDFAQHPDAKCFVQNPSGTWFKNTLTDNVWPDESWEAWFSDLKDPDGWVELNEGTVLGDWKDTLVKRPGGAS